MGVQGRLDSGRVSEQVRCLAATTPDVAGFFRLVNGLMEKAVGWDYASWSTVDPGTTIPTYTALYGVMFEPRVRSRIIELEFAGGDVNLFSDLARANQSVGTLRFATNGRPTTSRRFRELLRGIDCGDELRAVFKNGEMAWGFLIAYRSPGTRAFSGEEVRLVASAGQAVAEGLRHCLLRTAAGFPDRLPDGPGLLLLSESGRILETTPMAEEWLSMTGGSANWSSAVYSVAARAKRERFIVHLPVRAQGTGQCIILHGSATGNGAVAIIVEEARGAHLSNAISVLYGLTARERTVTEHVLHGRSTKEIAEDLGISCYTVQDHLKSIFDKVGVRSRLALASAFFHQCYEERWQSGSTPGPYGWYLDQ